MPQFIVLDVDADTLQHLAKLAAEIAPALAFEHLPDGSWLARPATKTGARGGKSRSAAWRRTRQNATRTRQQTATRTRQDGPENLENSGGYSLPTGSIEPFGGSESPKSATNRDATSATNATTRQRDNATEELTDDQCQIGKNGVAATRAMLDQTVAPLDVPR